MSVHNRLYVRQELFVNRVDGTDLTTADWAFLGTIDQNLATTDEVEFKTLSVAGATAFTTKITTAATGNYTLTLPVDDGNVGDVLKTDGSGNLSWDATGGFDQDLNTTNNVQFVDLTLTGNLTVNGTLTTISSTDLEVTDNIIRINKDEAGNGITLGSAGIQVERGNYADVTLRFNEATNTWQTESATDTASAGTFYDLVNKLDASVTGAIPTWDANGLLDTANGLTAAETTQLKNIDSTAINTTQWGYLGSMDQGVATTDTVTFDTVNVTTALNLSAGSSIAQSVSSVLTATTTVSEGISLFDTSGGALAANLPVNSSSAGKTYTIVLKTAGNNLTVTPNGADTIEGGASVILDVAGQHIRVTSLGDGVWIID